MNELNTVRPGDLVFYYYSDIGWGHVEIVTDALSSPTTFNYKFPLTPYPNEPEIIDHSGPNIKDKNVADELPRSMGDTMNDDIKQVEIMYGP